MVTEPKHAHDNADLDRADRRAKWAPYVVFLSLAIIALASVLLWQGISTSRQQAQNSSQQALSLAQQVAAACAARQIDTDLNQLCKNARQVEEEQQPLIGPQGPPGPIGLTGPQGPPGLDGLPGIGIKGDKGDPGEPGKDGVDGKDGADGTNGVDGVNGTNGTDGAPGVDGKDGRGIESMTCGDTGEFVVHYTDGTDQVVTGSECKKVTPTPP